MVPWTRATQTFRSTAWVPHATRAIRAARTKRQARHRNGADGMIDRTLPRPARMETSRGRDHFTRGGFCWTARPPPRLMRENALMRYDEPLFRLPIGGRLPRDRDAILAAIDAALAGRGPAPPGVGAGTLNPVRFHR